MAGDLVAQLLPQTGLYVGTDRDPTNESRSPQIARIQVTALPGGGGISFDYEGLSQDPDRPRPHVEHSVLGRTSAGLALYSAHSHAETLTELREVEPGYFVAVEGASPFPMAIRIEVPSESRIIYSWSYGQPGDELTVRNVADVALIE